jgi:hypothetical protein
MKTWWGGSIAPYSVNYGIRSRWAVSFTSRLLYPQKKIHIWRVWVSQEAGLEAAEKKILSLPGIELRFQNSPHQSLVITSQLSELSRINVDISE